MYPETQVQLYPLTISLQVAELLHGDDTHSFISAKLLEKYKLYKSFVDQIGSRDICLDTGAKVSNVCGVPLKTVRSGRRLKNHDCMD